ncbi:MAG TPA: hypothetical protein VF799_11440, partial [Geobacteraceae bacterium]
MTITGGTAHAGAGFDIGINLGGPVYAAPPVPVYIPPSVPVPPPQPAVLDEPPQFITPRDLGFRVAVGVPYDLYYVADSYYVCRDNVWYRARSYNGPWMTVRYRALPWELRRYPVAFIRSARDAAYWHCDDNHDGWRHLRGDREWRDRSRWEHDRGRQWQRDDDDD